MKFAYTSKNLLPYDFGHVLGVRVAAERLKRTDGQHHLRRSGPDASYHGRRNQCPETYDEHTEKEFQKRRRPGLQSPRLRLQERGFPPWCRGLRVWHFESTVSR